jgi:SUMO ligase MMS21 Smc5/6 complex component
MNILYINHGTYTYEIIIILIIGMIKWISTILAENQQYKQCANRQQDIPQHVVQRLIKYAALNKELCPITFNTIATETSSITSCFHVFDTEAIQHSLQMNDTCPVCRHPSPALLPYVA